MSRGDAKTERWRPRFRLSTVALVVLLLCVCLAWWVDHRRLKQDADHSLEMYFFRDRVEQQIREGYEEQLKQIRSAQILANEQTKNEQ